MQDAVGVAGRGDRLASVIHEEVSKNISGRGNHDTRSTVSETRADARGRGKTAGVSSLTHLLI